MEESISKSEKAYHSNPIIKILSWIDRWIIEVFEKFILSFGLLALSVIVFGIVIARYFLGFSPDWSDELPRFMVVWITFIGMSYCVRQGSHVKIDLFLNKMQGKVKKYINVTILLICFLFFVYLTYLGYNLTMAVFAANQMSVSLDISLGYVYMAIPIGCFLTAKNFLHLLIKNILSKEVIPDLSERGIK